MSELRKRVLSVPSSRAQVWSGPQGDAVSRLTEVLVQYEGVEAGYLVGSLARGNCDRWSDVDYHVYCSELRDWREPLKQAFPRAFVSEFGRAGERGARDGAFALLPEGQKVDIFAKTVAELPPSALFDFIPLFDSDAVCLPASCGAAVTPGVRSVGEYYPEHAVKSFYFAVEAVVQLIARDEGYLCFRNAQIRCEVAWVPLLVAEQGIEVIAGKRRLRGFLAADQNAILNDIAEYRFTSRRELLLATQRELEEFSARARRLASAHDAEFPQRLADIVSGKLVALSHVVD